MLPFTERAETMLETNATNHWMFDMSRTVAAVAFHRDRAAENACMGNNAAMRGITGCWISEQSSHWIGKYFCS